MSRPPGSLPDSNMNVTSFWGGEAKWRKPPQLQKAQRVPRPLQRGHNGKGRDGERERERESWRERRESTHCSVVQVLGPKQKSAHGRWVRSPITQWAFQATDTGCWTEASGPQPSLLSCGTAPWKSPHLQLCHQRSHLPGTFCILSFTLHAPSVRLELFPFYRRGN